MINRLTVDFQDYCVYASNTPALEPAVSFTRRDFLTASALVSASSVVGCVARHHQLVESSKAMPRLVVTTDASPVILAAARDVSRLLAAAIGQDVPLVVSSESTSEDWLLLVISDPVSRAWRNPTAVAGAFSVTARSDPSQPLVIVGHDAEGVRNGLYQLLQRLGFGFFSDGISLPSIEVASLIHWDQSFEGSPRFLSRGEMFWDNYMGLRTMCPATWGELEWENALLFLARNGHNFCEFYPPIEAVVDQAFPGMDPVNTGVVWSAKAKLELTKRVLARGRELGIRFMYVLVYGHFPSAIRGHFPELQWRGEFLCGHGEAMSDLAGTVWSKLIDILGTDHLYALRHRGEDGQSYSNPCRDLSKIDGHIEGIQTLERIDPQAETTVWTWGEEPELHDALPPNVKAVHIRHGVGDVFTSDPIGREQNDGPPKLNVARPWLSAQFTVFGGQETLIRTAWSDAGVLARDVQSSAQDPLCEGYFHWPEWSNTSPWLSHVIARLAWSPSEFDSVTALSNYAKVRHRNRANTFLLAVKPLIEGGNSSLMGTPRKRLLLPFVLTSFEQQLLKNTRAGLQQACSQLSMATTSLMARDLGDVLIWVALKQAQTLETASWLAHLRFDTQLRLDFSQGAISTWHYLANYLRALPRWSLLESAQAMAAERALNADAADHFRHLSLSFYKGYPMTLSAESVSDYILPQSNAMFSLFETAEAKGEITALEKTGWYWRDDTAEKWTSLARAIPDGDVEAFEKGITEQLVRIFSVSIDSVMSQPSLESSVHVIQNSVASETEIHTLKKAAAGLISLTLPEELDEALEYVG